METREPVLVQGAAQSLAHRKGWCSGAVVTFHFYRNTQVWVATGEIGSCWKALGRDGLVQKETHSVFLTKGVEKTLELPLPFQSQKLLETRHILPKPDSLESCKSGIQKWLLGISHSCPFLQWKQLYPESVAITIICPCTHKNGFYPKWFPWLLPLLRLL